jgi:hypothetical protein
MWNEMIAILSGWSRLDTWIVVTAALAAMACALPGTYLVIRRQSMIGDALAHTALPGVVIAFLVTHEVYAAGWISQATYDAWLHAALMVGAVVLGILSALLTEWLQRLGRVESAAARGVARGREPEGRPSPFARPIPRPAAAPATREATRPAWLVPAIVVGLLMVVLGVGLSLLLTLP